MDQGVPDVLFRFSSTDKWSWWRQKEGFGRARRDPPLVRVWEVRSTPLVDGSRPGNLLFDSDMKTNYNPVPRETFEAPLRASYFPFHLQPSSQSLHLVKSPAKNVCTADLGSMRMPRWSSPRSTLDWDSSSVEVSLLHFHYLTDTPPDKDLFLLSGKTRKGFPPDELPLKRALPPFWGKWAKRVDASALGPVRFRGSIDRGSIDLFRRIPSMQMRILPRPLNLHPPC